MNDHGEKEEALLSVEELEVGYGPFRVLMGVSIVVRRGEVVAVVGANGAGKSTLLNTIAGLLLPRRGRILFEGEDVTRVPAHARVQLGMALVPEGRRIFSELNVLENLLIGSYPRHARGGSKESLRRVFDLFPILESRQRQQARTLSGGEQQMLAIGRALMSKPKLLLLDEMSLGLAPLVVDRLYYAIERIRLEGTTILFVEQNVRKSLSHSDRGYLMKGGRIALSGPSRDLLRERSIRQAYFGI
jgi:branched-chain amino acid transport system ATP-binding protein